MEKERQSTKKKEGEIVRRETFGIEKRRERDGQREKSGKERERDGERKGRWVERENRESDGERGDSNEERGRGGGREMRERWMERERERGGGRGRQAGCMAAQAAVLYQEAPVGVFPPNWVESLKPCQILHVC